MYRLAHVIIWGKSAIITFSMMCDFRHQGVFDQSASAADTLMKHSCAFLPCIHSLGHISTHCGKPKTVKLGVSASIGWFDHPMILCCTTALAQGMVGQVRRTNFASFKMRQSPGLYFSFQTGALTQNCLSLSLSLSFHGLQH